MVRATKRVEFDEREEEHVSRAFAAEVGRGRIPINVSRLLIAPEGPYFRREIIIECAHRFAKIECSYIGREKHTQAAPGKKVISPHKFSVIRYIGFHGESFAWGLAIFDAPIFKYRQTQGRSLSRCVRIGIGVGNGGDVSEPDGGFGVGWGAVIAARGE